MGMEKKVPRPIEWDRGQLSRLLQAADDFYSRKSRSLRERVG